MRADDMILGATLSALNRLNEASNTALFEELKAAGHAVFNELPSLVDAFDLSEELAQELSVRFNVDQQMLDDEISNLAQTIYTIVMC